MALSNYINLNIQTCVVIFKYFITTEYLIICTICFNPDTYTYIFIFIPEEAIISNTPPHEYFIKYTGNPGKDGYLKETQGNIAMNIIKYQCFSGNPGNGYEYNQNIIQWI